MRKLVLVVHTSLDGFVAGLKGELDGFEPGEENLQFVCEITEEADAALIGRKSYEMLQKYWPTAKNNPKATKGEMQYSNWYNNAQKIVISKTMSSELLENTIIISAKVVDEISAIKKQIGRNILLFGSPSVSQLLLQNNLVDEIWIFINPAIFAQGIPLFNGVTNKAKLTLINTKQFSNGEMALLYIVNKE